VYVRGNGFQVGATVTFAGSNRLVALNTFFRSEELLAVQLPNMWAQQALPTGIWDVTVTNADSQSLTLKAGLTVGP
jgi:hypothetical protein